MAHVGRRVIQQTVAQLGELDERGAGRGALSQFLIQGLRRKGGTIRKAEQNTSLPQLRAECSLTRPAEKPGSRSMRCRPPAAFRLARA
jgi:hypothetical protein